MLQRLSDEDLMVQFQAGVVDAFDLLVRRHTDRLARFIRSFVGDPDLCEDLIQETFVRVYRNRHSYRSIARFTTWMYTIARNLALSEIRKRKSALTFPLSGSSDVEDSVQPDIPDDSFSPERHTEDQLCAHHIGLALKEVPDVFREVVVLRDVQQLTYEEISEITGLPLGTVKSRIHRGRTVLKGLLEEVYTTQEVYASSW